MRLLKAGVGALVALALAFGVLQWWNGRGTAVFESVVAPVEVTIRPPQFVTRVPRSRDDDTGRGRFIGAGGETRRIASAGDGTWLDDGRYALTRYWPFKCEPTDEFMECSRSDERVLDVVTGKLRPLPGVPTGAGIGISEWPEEAVHRLNVQISLVDEPWFEFLTFASDMSSHERLRPPPYDGRRGDISRDTSSRLFTIGEWDYLRFSDNDEEDFTEDYGYLRHRHGTNRWEKVLQEQRLVAIWVSRDGSALLGLQQRRGEPCGGCLVRQRIVEIDPEKGVIAATYGVPAGYDKSWRVGDVDKVGDRVLVQYLGRGDVPENRGVWQYDGDWSLVPGTNGRFTWWQGPEDRIEAVPFTRPDGLHRLRLEWVHGHRRTSLPGELGASDVEGYRGAPGSLVPLS